MRSNNLLLPGLRVIAMVAVLAAFIRCGQWLLDSVLADQREHEQAVKDRCFECGAMYCASDHKFNDGMMKACGDCYPGLQVADIPCRFPDEPPCRDDGNR